jgi:hypothetical protein
MKYLTEQTIIIFIIIFFLFSCSSTEKKGIQLRKTSIEMQKEINKFIIIGMPIKEAELITEKSQFDCKKYKSNDEKNQFFNPFNRKGDLSICGITHSYLIASKSWHIYILEKNNKVSMIKAVVTDQNP